MISRGIRNNNPFNIRFVESNLWKGKVPKDKNTDYNHEFEQFVSFDLGVRAGLLLFGNYINRGIKTPRAILEKFAPQSDGNNVDQYVSFVCDAAHISESTPLQWGSVFFLEFCRFVMYYESDYLVTSETMWDYFNSFWPIDPNFKLKKPVKDETSDIHFGVCPF